MYNIRNMEFEGFGKVHTGEEWAFMLDLPLDRFAYYTGEKGLTVADLYTIKGIPYSDLKNRRGYQIEKTRRRIESILAQSGYSTARVDILTAPGQAAHRIVVNGEQIGKYFYREDRLVLSNKEGFFLGKIADHEIKIMYGANGWEWHPKTKLIGFKIGV